MASQSASYPVPEESRVLLWAGEDPALHANLLEKLEAAGIPYSDKPIGDDETAPSADPLPIDWKPRFGFEVAVASSDFAPAKEILESLLMQEPANMELPAQESAPQPPPTLMPKAGAATPSELVVEAWSGVDERTARFLMASLEENEIPAHLETAVGGLQKIFVAPVNEGRAREIVREVTQGAPPE